MPLATPRARALRAALALAALTLAPAARAQQTGTVAGTVAGTVVDAETGETLIGVNVVVAGTTTGTTTDLDGAYRLPLAPGTYDLAFSYVGFDGQTVEGVRVEAGRTVTLDLRLHATSVGLGELTVQAEAVLGQTEASLLLVQSRAPAILDGLAAQQIRRAPDASTGEALRRVTGVTLSGGRFVSVRGVPERYNGTLLNGTPVPSTEPDRRAFTYDLIPANLLANVLVAKSATPDLPGDFAGGVLQLNTVDFPERFTAGATLGLGANNATGSAFLQGPRGGLPAAFPATNIGAAEVTPEQRAGYGRLLPNGYLLDRDDAPVTPNFSLSMGGSSPSALGRLGAVGAVTYRSGYALADVVRRDYESGGELRFDYAGVQYAYTRTLGGLLNLGYRPSGFHSLTLKNFYTWTADDEVTQLAGALRADLGADLQQTAIRYVARSLHAGQLGGEHFFPGPGARLDWAAYRATTTRDEPDYRRAVYFRDLDAEAGTPYRLLIGPTVSLANGGRFYSDLDEVAWGGTLRAELPVAGLRLTVGGLAEARDRAFASRLLAAVTPRRDFDFGLLDLPLDSVFAPENFGRLGRAGCEGGGAGCEGFLLGELQTGGQNYTAGQDLAAGFVMVDAPLRPLSAALRLVGGVRVEHAVQTVVSTTTQGDPVDVRAATTNLLPSLNLTYALAERTNLRAAYSRNLNRPELRELAPFQYYDFELQTTVYGNDSLRQATIHNLDLRFETFPGAGELLSASLFYKRFDDPIERAIVPGVALNAERSFTNADYANTYGLEVEARHGLGFLARYLAASSVLVNYTWVQSDVAVRATATTLPREGRPLQGQSPYVVNLGLNLVEPTLGTAVSLFYNRLGSRIVEVATAFQDDVVEAPRDLLDLTVTQPLMGRYELRLAARDLLDQPQRFLQGDRLIRENVRGRSVSLSVSMRL